MHFVSLHCVHNSHRVKHTGELGILQWNAGGFPQQRENDLFQAMTASDCGIAAIQEMKWHEEHNPAPNYDGCEVFFKQHSYKQRKNQRGGAAFIVRNDVVVSEEKGFSSEICAVWIRVHLKDKKSLLLGNAYIPPQEYALIPKLERLVTRLPKYSILCGDFNAHNKMWDSNTPENSAGRRLAEVIDNSSIILLNEPDIPTRLTSRISAVGVYTQSRTVIDLAFCSPEAYKFTERSRLPNEVLSYAPHRPLRLSFSLATLPKFE